MNRPTHLALMAVPGLAFGVALLVAGTDMTEWRFYVALLLILIGEHVALAWQRRWS